MNLSLEAITRRKRNDLIYVRHFNLSAVDQTREYKRYIEYLWMPPQIPP